MYLLAIWLVLGLMQHYLVKTFSKFGGHYISHVYMNMLMYFEGVLCNITHLKT